MGLPSDASGTAPRRAEAQNRGRSLFHWSALIFVMAPPDSAPHAPAVPSTNALPTLILRQLCVSDVKSRPKHTNLSSPHRSDRFCAWRDSDFPCPPRQPCSGRIALCVETSTHADMYGSCLKRASVSVFGAYLLKASPQIRQISRSRPGYAGPALDEICGSLIEGNTREPEQPHLQTCRRQKSHVPFGISTKKSCTLWPESLPTDTPDQPQSPRTRRPSPGRNRWVFN